MSTQTMRTIPGGTYGGTSAGTYRDAYGSISASTYSGPSARIVSPPMKERDYQPAAINGSFGPVDEV